MRVFAAITLFVLLIGVAFTGIWRWRSEQNNHKRQALVLYGNVDVRQVNLAINGTDRIAELLVEEGDRVKKDDLLAKLVTTRLQYAVEAARASLEQQRQIVARLEAGSRPEEITKARADLQAARARAEDARRTYHRLVELRKSSAVSQQGVDDSLAALESAEAQVTALDAERELVIAGPRKEDIAAAKALLQRYEAEMARAELDLAEAHLYASNDGVVQERMLEVGDMASPQKTVYSVALTDPIWVRAYVSEPDLGKIFEGMKATVVTDSFPEKRYDGWIGFISPIAEFTPKPVETPELRSKLVYQIRVFVKNPNNELRLGMPATVTIRLDQQRVTLTEKAAKGTPN
jgi:HlyD family secretion protein